MSTSSTRQRLTQAALELFLSQGVSHTTTRQIADKAGVNEATLFRNFGNKYGLLLSLLQDTPAIAAGPQLLPAGPSPETLRTYASECLHLLGRISSFIRSVIGEADQYPPEHRQALRQRLSAIRLDMTQHLNQLIEEDTARLPADELASFLGALLVGYTVVETTSGYPLWENRDDFLDTLVTVLTNEPQSTTGNDAASERRLNTVCEDALPPSQEAMDVVSPPPEPSQTLIFDLPTAWVHQMMKQARGLGAQDYGLAYLLFGAGLLPEEVVGLERSHQICDKSQNILQVIGKNSSRQVPVNQWILGKRYGSYTNNPLTKWLKTRKDDTTSMFTNEAGAPITVVDIQTHWDTWWQGIEVGALRPLPTQARQTWCVEMLMRGISLENLSILTGCDVPELRPYAQRATAKAAIAAATQLDRKAP